MKFSLSGATERWPELYPVSPFSSSPTSAGDYSMIPTIESIVEMLIAKECTAQEAIRWIGIHMLKAREA
jgi:hypothetical protein